MIVIAVFSLMIVAIFQMLTSAQKNLESELAHNSVESTATTMIDAIGRDVRESSYPYVFAGDWLATNSGGTASIMVARNYFSVSPSLGGATLVPGLTNEGGAQCVNTACNWSTDSVGGNTVPSIPNAFLANPSRNYPQTGTATDPSTAFSFSANDARGRLLRHLTAGDTCPFCGGNTSSQVFLGGLLIFSPRGEDRFFSYGGDSGYEAQWESMVFYCPFYNAVTNSFELRRYAFFASAFVDGTGTPANLIDLLDFDDNGVIESPPMTDENGNFLLDADGERFCLVPAGSGPGNDLLYTRWGSGRVFRIQVDRITGQAVVTVTGSGFAGTQTLSLEIKRFGLGLSDMDVSTYLNNASWFNAGTQVNPTGVVEPGVVRISVQVDRPAGTTRGNTFGREETVQMITMRPRN
jgi:hypothetical protein